MVVVIMFGLNDAIYKAGIKGEETIKIKEVIS